MVKHHTGGKTPYIRNLGTRRRYVVSFTFRPSYSRVNSTRKCDDGKLTGMSRVLVSAVPFLYCRVLLSVNMTSRDPF
jgi:hypothetical protein